MVCFQPTHTSVGRSLCIRSCGDRNCSWRATVRLEIDTLIANILVTVESPSFPRRSTPCTRQELGREHSILPSHTNTIDFYQVYHGVRRCVNKKLSYRRGTARRAMSDEILSTAAQLYEKSHSKRLAIDEWPWRSLFKVIGISTIR